MVGKAMGPRMGCTPRIREMHDSFHFAAQCCGCCYYYYYYYPIMVTIITIVGVRIGARARARTEEAMGRPAAAFAKGLRRRCPRSRR